MNAILHYIHDVPAAAGLEKILLDMLLKGTVILLVTGTACLLLQKASAAVRCVAWSLAMISLLLLPILSGILPHWQARILPTESVQAPVESAGNDSLVQAYEGERFADVAQMGYMDRKDNTGAGHVPVYTGSSDSTPKADHTAPAAVALNNRVKERSVMRAALQGLRRLTVQSWLCIAWIAGVVCMVLPIFSGLAWIAYYSRKSTRIVTGRMAEILRHSITVLHVRRPVRLLQWNGQRTLTMPTTWGIFRPVIVMPRAAEYWPEERIQVALMHELAHIKRLDWPVQLLSRLACAAYWFNPLAWLACRYMRIECEQACDDAVLQAGHTGPDYAGHLLDIVKSMCVKRHTAMVTVPMARVSTVEGRIRAILDGTRKRWTVTRWAVLGVTIAALGVLIPFAAMQATARTIRTVRKTVTVTSKGTNETVVVSNIVVTSAGNVGMTEEAENIVNQIDAMGLTQPYTLSFEVPGRIITVKPQGTLVTNGEIVASLDPRRYQNAAGIARADVTRAEAIVSLAEETYSALTPKGSAGLVSQADIKKKETELIIAKTDLKKAQIALKGALLNLEACILRAPAAGKIVSVFLPPGAAVQAGTPVVRIIHEHRDNTQTKRPRTQHTVSRKSIDDIYMTDATKERTLERTERRQSASEPDVFKFVRLVVGPGTMTFEGKDVTWETLPGELDKVTDRPVTVLEFAQPENAKPDMIAFGKTIRLAQMFNFNHVSDIGEKPLGTKGTVRYTGMYETGRKLPVTLSAGTANQDGIVTVQAITFTTEKNGTIKADIDYILLSGPKSRWRIVLSLLDGEGKEVVGDRTSIENHGVIIGQPFAEQKKAVFHFSGIETTVTIKQFRISISQGFLSPEQVVVEAQLVLQTGGKEKVISRPMLMGHTGKEAEIFVGAQEPVPGKLVDTGTKIIILPTVKNGILSLRGKAIFAEVAGISSNSISKASPLKWHSVKENMTEFDVIIEDQDKQYTVGPIPYKENETLLIRLKARLDKAKAQYDFPGAGATHAVIVRKDNAAVQKKKGVIEMILAKGFGSGKTVQGSGNVITVPRDLPPCRGIRNTTSLDIHIRRHEEPSLSLTGDDNILPLVKTEVKNKILVITTDGSYSSKKGITIDVFLPAIEVLDITGSGDAKVEGLKERELKLTQTGSGDITADGTAETLTITSTGSGDCTISSLEAKRVLIRKNGSGDITGSGTADTLDIFNKGSGDMNFKEVCTGACTIQSTGSGNITVTVHEALNAQATGSGDIEYFGEPKVVNSNVSGSGKIKGETSSAPSGRRKTKVNIQKR